VDDEYEKVLSHTHASLLKREETYSLDHQPRTVGSSPRPGVVSVASSYESRLRDLRSSHQATSTQETDFLSQLRKKALTNQEKLFHPDDTTEQASSEGQEAKK
jgi:hypothetical protein